LDARDVHLVFRDVVPAGVHRVVILELEPFKHQQMVGTPVGVQGVNGVCYCHRLEKESGKSNQYVPSLTGTWKSNDKFGLSARSTTISKHALLLL
jgi:hypothetical protein